MTPLANILRPNNLSDFIGQEHLVGLNKPIRLLIEKKKLYSIIFWGPPGSGKTTLARIIAKELSTNFFYISAVSSNKAEMKSIVSDAIANSNKKTILFIDEIHRFNKSQQDYLLPFVEDGTIVLIGATTENPSFSVISALLSRSQIYVLKPHTKQDLIKILNKASQKLGIDTNNLSPESIEFLLNYANGDARKLINLIDQSFQLNGNIDIDSLKSTLQSRYIRYDKHGDEHYDTISAFIKSMRAGQVDSAIYYLARMIEAGEDPLFIARRMVIFASEDIGIAQPTALVVANAVYRAVETIGYPECSINLMHGVVYLTKSKKDRSSYDALQRALADVKKYGNLPIPLRIRNAPTQLMKDLGYHKGYKKYDKESYLPDKIKHKRYFKT